MAWSLHSEKQEQLNMLSSPYVIRSSLKPFLAALVVLISILTALFFPVLFEKKIILPADQLNTMILPYSYGKQADVYNHFLNDSITQYYIYKSLTKKALDEKRFAYWNPLILGGFPQYALTMAGNFDISNILLGLFKDRYHAYVFQLLFTFLLAGLSMFFLLMYFYKDTFVSVIIAASYMLNSMFITTCFLRWILASFCWIPLVILFLDKSLEKNRPRDFVLCGIFLSFAFLGSSMQTAVFILLLILLYFVLFITFRRSSNPSFAKYFSAMIIILSLGFSLSAFMWFPTFELFYHSHKLINFGESTESIWQRLMAFPLLASFVFPELAGSVRAFDLTKLVNATMMHFNGYIGFIPFFFGIGACVNRPQKAKTWIFICIAVFGLFIPLCTPLLGFFYHRFFIIFIFAMCLLAGCGLNHYLKQGDKTQYLRLLKWTTGSFIILVILLVVANLAVKAFYSQAFAFASKYVEANLYKANLLAGNRDWYLERVSKLFQHFRITSPSMFIPILAIFLSLCGIYLHIIKRISTKVFLALILFLNCFQLILFARGWLPMLDTRKYPLYPDNEITRLLQQDKGIFRVKLYPTDKDAHPIFSPNILSAYGIETIDGYESVEPPTVSWLVNGLNPRLLGTVNVKYVITHEKNAPQSPGLKFIYKGSGVNVFENLLFKPRAFLVYHYTMLPGAKVLEGIREGRLKLDEYVYLESDPGIKMNAHILPGAGSLIFNQYNEEALNMEVFTPRGAFLVVSNTYYPGWRCYLDEKEVPVLRANYSMMAVFLPEGAHKVKFYFKPKIFYVGLAVSLSITAASIILLLSLTIYHKK